MKTKGRIQSIWVRFKYISGANYISTFFGLMVIDTQLKDEFDHQDCQHSIVLIGSCVFSNL